MRKKRFEKLHAHVRRAKRKRKRKREEETKTARQTDIIGESVNELKPSS